MESINWYKKLDPNQRIYLKECFILLCGVEWGSINFLIPLIERIDIAYNKIKKENI